MGETRSTKLSSSIIIPTLNRVADLGEALCSILDQTELPLEVLVVDSSNNNETETYIEGMSVVFKQKNVILRYVRNKRELSLTISRNIGASLSTAEIVFFMDDDIILDKNYVKNILKVYESHPTVKGVEGLAINWQLSSRIDNLLWEMRRFFFLFSFERNNCRVLKSGNNTYPVPLTKIVECQWLCGVCSYRREVFEKFQFDERLKRWAFKEDEDFSYRVYGEYPGSLLITPEATFFHKYSDRARSSNKKVRYMIVIYGAYFFYKNMPQTIGNKLCFVISLIFGFAIENLKPTCETVKQDFLSIVYMFVHLKQIKRGDLQFFDNFLQQKAAER
jgi:glucosyl-dolichyl phosphate glucuronosyltransferase